MIKKLILIFTIFTVSCWKQSPKEIVKELSEQDRLLACSNTNVVKNAFLYKNLVDIFVCTRWNNKFPKIYKGIVDVGEEDWNHLFSPINRELYNDIKTKKLLLGLTGELDDRNGLDDFGRVLTSLSDVNSYNGLYAVFTCANDPSSSICIEREVTGSRSDIENLIRELDSDPKMLGHILEVIDALLRGLSPYSKKIQKEIHAYYKDPSYIKMRVDFLDSFFKSFSGKKSKAEREFFRDLLRSDSPFFRWLKQTYLSESELNKVLEFSGDDSFVLDHLSITGTVSETIRCTIDDGSLLYRFDGKSYFKEFLDFWKNSSQSDFLIYMADDMATTLFASEYCPDVARTNVEISIKGDSFIYPLEANKVRGKLVDFIKNDKFFFLGKTFVTNLIDTNFDNGGNFLLKFFGADLMWDLGKISLHINRLSPNFFYTLYGALKNMDDEGYEAFGNLIGHMSSEESDKFFSSFYNIWRMFSSEEKNFIVGFLDQHFDLKTDYLLLFDFYIKTLGIIKDKFPMMIKDYNKDEVAVDRTFESINSFAKAFSGVGKNEEFKKFFSREHMLEIILLLSGRFDPDRRYDFEQLDKINNEKMTWPKLIPPPVGDELAICIHRIYKEKKSFPDFVRNIPSECLDSPMIGMEIVKDVGLLATLLSKGHDIPYKKMFGENGFFSGNTLATTTAMVSAVDKSMLSIGKKGIGDLTNTLKKYLIDFEYQNSNGIDIYRSLWEEISKYLSSLDIRNRNRLVSTFLDEGTNNAFNKLLISYSSLLNDFYKDKYKEDYLKLTSKKRNECEDVINTNLGPKVCPTKGEVSASLKKISKYLLRKNGAGVTALNQLVKVFHPYGGVEIPYQSNSGTFKYISFYELFDFLFQTSDKSLSRNNKKIKLYHYRTRNPRNVIMTTLDRVEAVIREVDFDSNYLGAHYKNATSKSIDYSSVVKSKYSIMSKCVPLRFCGKSMSSKEKAKAKNTLAVYPALWEVNEFGWQYADFMKALLTVFISSSSPEAQVSDMIDWSIGGVKIKIPKILKSKDLRKHNGKILTELSHIGAFMNAARWLRNSFASDKNEFYAILNSKKFQITSRYFFDKIDISSFDTGAKELLYFLMEKGPSEKAPVDDLLTWLASLNDEQLNNVEIFTGNLLHLLTYVGNDELLSVNEGRFKKLNLNKLVKNIDQFAKLFYSIKKNFPEEFKYIDLIEEISPFITFVSDVLEDGTEAQKKSAFHVVNETYTIFNKVFMNTFNEKMGVEYFREYIKDRNKSYTLYLAIKRFNKLVEYWSLEGDVQKKSKDINLFLSNFLNRDDYNYYSMRRFLWKSTFENNCTNSRCSENYFYDFYLSALKSMTDVNNNPNMVTLTKKYISDIREDITSYLERVFKYFVSENQN